MDAVNASLARVNSRRRSTKLYNFCNDQRAIEYLQNSHPVDSETPAGIRYSSSSAGTGRIFASSARRGLQSENGRGLRRAHRRSVPCDQSRRVWPTEHADHASSYILCTADTSLPLCASLRRGATDTLHFSRCRCPPKLLSCRRAPRHQATKDETIVT
jgi:hypothetical protein